MGSRLYLRHCRTNNIWFWIVGNRQNPGHFEQIVLLALLRLGPSAYGVTIHREIGERTGNDASIGAVYTTLSRLEEKGYVKSRMGEPTEERGGRAKKYFAITGAGQLALHRAEDELRAMREGLGDVQPA